MIRKLYSYAGMLLLAGAAFFATADAGWAQHGGGHFGGAHFGGARFGGAHLGAYHGGYHLGYHPDYSHYGYHPYYHHYGFYNSYPYYYGYYPYSYGYYPYNDTYPYVGSGLTYDSAYYGLSGGGTPPDPDGYTSVTPPAASYQTYSLPATGQPDAISNAAPGTDQPDRIAHVTVQAPADAQVWFDDTATTSTGSIRDFDSPPLTPGQRYSYQIRVRWHANGQEVTQTQQVEVRAGSHVNVDFPLPPKTAGQASAARKG